MQEGNVSTISSSIKLIEGFERAELLLLGGTQFYINNALYSTKSKGNLLSFKDIRWNGYHIMATNECNIKCLCITSIISSKECIMEKLLAFSSGLFYTYLSKIETYAMN